MKHLNCLALVFLSLLTLLVSCQKSLHGDAQAAVVAFLPKQIIITDTTKSPATRSRKYYSLQYAAGNRQIDIYLDDTTTSNPYDVLNNSFVYNSAGYLTGWIEQDPAGQAFYSVSISRSNDNRIKYLVNLYKYAGEILQNDTSFFSYQQSGAGMQVSTIEKNVDYVGGQPQPAYYDSVQYSYDAANNLQEVTVNAAFSISNGTYLYTYNANGSVRNIHLSGFLGKTMDANFVYNSGLADAKADVLAQLLLGKDFYLQDIRYFPSTGDRLDEPNYFIVSLTNPFHISAVQVTLSGNGNNTSQNYNYSYQLHPNLLPATTGSAEGVVTEFRY